MRQQIYYNILESFFKHLDDETLTRLKILIHQDHDKDKVEIIDRQDRNIFNFGRM